LCCAQPSGTGMTMTTVFYMESALFDAAHCVVGSKSTPGTPRVDAQRMCKRGNPVRAGTPALPKRRACDGSMPIGALLISGGLGEIQTPPQRLGVFWHCGMRVSESSRV
jgi:hypothetical protein